MIWDGLSPSGVLLDGLLSSGMTLAGLSSSAKLGSREVKLLHSSEHKLWVRFQPKSPVEFCSCSFLSLFVCTVLHTYMYVHVHSMHMDTFIVCMHVHVYWSSDSYNFKQGTLRPNRSHAPISRLYKVGLLPFYIVLCNLLMLYCLN